MAAITIDSTDLECSDGGELDPIPIGQRSRAYAGNDRNSIRTQRRRFSVVSAPTIEATWDTIRASTEDEAQITVSGPVLSGDSYTASCISSAKAIPGLPGFFIISVSGEEV